MGVGFRQPIPLSPSHDIANFDCGEEALNSWLKEFGIEAARQNSARTFVTLAIDAKNNERSASERVAGYYSISTGQVFPAEASARVRTGLGQYGIPVILLARLAVDRAFQGNGLGRGLVKDCALRVVRLSEEVGIRALMTQALNDEAKEFYMSLGFEESPIKANLLMMLLKDLRSSFPVN